MFDNVWVTIALLIAPLIGGIVGFGLQIHQLRAARLNYEKAALEVEVLRQKIAQDSAINLKLELEIEDLRARIGGRETRSELMHSLSTDEVIRFADIRFSRSHTPDFAESRPATDNIILPPSPWKKDERTPRRKHLLWAVGLALIVVFSYLVVRRW